MAQRGRRWAALGLGVAVTVGGQVGELGPQSWSASARPRSTAATVSQRGTPACLGADLGPSDDCPEFAVSVALSVDGTELDLTFVNEASEPWPGGPLAVELPRPGAAVGAVAGTVPGREEVGWRTVAGVVVARCVYPAAGPEGLVPGARVECSLPLDRKSVV